LKVFRLIRSFSVMVIATSNAPDHVALARHLFPYGHIFEGFDRVYRFHRVNGTPSSRTYDGSDGIPLVVSKTFPTWELAQEWVREDDRQRRLLASDGSVA
jgi:hypothetical protein